MNDCRIRDPYLRAALVIAAVAAVGWAAFRVFFGSHAQESTAEVAFRPAAPRSEPCPVVRVVDGDTVVLRRGDTEERVRLLRIDTPERGEPGFEEATEALRRLVEGREVLLEFEKPGVEERDRYGRLLAYVFVNANTEMVRLGHSRFWTRYGRGRYAGQFEAAEREGMEADEEESPSED